MSHVAIFGATGKTGRRVLEQALDAGHSARVLVRDPDRLTRRDERIGVVAGDVLDPASVRSTVEGADVVLSLFGHVKGSPRRLQTDGTRNIVSAMQAQGVRRIVSLSGGGVPADGDRPRAADRAIRLLKQLVAKDVLADAVAHVQVLRGSGLDWTVVRAPRLTEAPGTGAYRVGMVGVDASTSISRDDLARFLLAQVDDDTYVGRLPFVSA